MPNTVFSPSIDSRPTYAGLAPRSGAPAIMVADEAGAAALTDLATADATAMAKSHVVLVGVAAETGAAMAALSPAAMQTVPDLDTATPIVQQVLSQARMGTQMFLAGSEGLMGHISAMALASGLALEDIQMEHRGSIARRMQCVHCKGITDGVTTDPFTCSHCGLTLFVRDHFSRRLGAFQGVCVDAETPGDIPATEEIRP